MRWLFWGALACVLVAGAAALGAFGPSPRARAARLSAAEQAAAVREAPPSLEPPSAAPPAAQVRWIAAGGGPYPELNQVSMAQDLALAAEVLGDGGLVLFASGHRGAVQVLDGSRRGDPLVARLAGLFAPRPGRDAHYEPAPVSAHGEATAERVLAAIASALAAGETPLLVYLASHGDMGETARDNRLPLWADSMLSVADLARVLDERPPRRAVRLVVTACHSGGFAEIIFRDADEEAGPADGVRCGLFAATWDLKATGCDPDPDRRAQEGYGLHFLHALHGQDRDGEPLDAGRVDFDHDGRVTLLEAHTRTRIASASIDVPTSTSERWLRGVAPTSGRSAPVSLPEEDAVVTALAPRLGLADDPGRARDRLAADEEALHALEERAEDLDARAADATRTVAAALLSRFPVLDDPWHPDWTRTLTGHRAEIEATLREHPALGELESVRADQERLNAETEILELEAAHLERLVRALDNRTLAGRLRARGGDDWRTYERILSCERSEP
jgi:hypothetical protein